MLSIKMSGRMRLNAELIVGQQRGNVADMAIWGDIWRKVQLDKDQRATAVTSLPGGQALINWSIVDQMPESTVELETEEARKLLATLKTFDGYGPSDLEWVKQLIERIETGLSA